MTTDRELLEWAAKAAGIPVRWNESPPCTVMTDYFGDAGFWNPLVDDGDALRLAVKLGIGFTFSNDATWIDMSLERMEKAEQEGRQLTMWQIHEDEPYAATRRAIVRAAASIGQQMEK